MWMCPGRLGCCGRWRAASRRPGRRPAPGSTSAGSTRTSSGPRRRCGSAPRALHRRLGGELHVVLAVAVARPDVEQRAGERLAVEVGDAARVERRLARDAFADVGCRAAGRARRASRTGPSTVASVAARRAGRAAAGARLLQRDDHHRQAERVGQQDELGPLVGRDLAGAGEEVDAGEPLSGVRSTSRAKACRCRTSAAMISLKRGSTSSPRRASTAWVMSWVWCWVMACSIAGFGRSGRRFSGDRTGPAGSPPR